MIVEKNFLEKFYCIQRYDLSCVVAKSSKQPHGNITCSFNVAVSTIGQDLKLLNSSAATNSAVTADWSLYFCPLINGLK